MVRCSVRSVQQGAAQEWRKFSCLGPALAEDAQVVLWAVGVNELRAGLRAEDICLHLLFLAQAAHAAGALPVLMTLPPIPGLPAAELRRTALLTKELAYKLGTPVVDAYSAAKIKGTSSGCFDGFFLGRNNIVSLVAPNDTGRKWLCQLVAGRLRTVLRSAECPRTPEP